MIHFELDQNIMFWGTTFALVLAIVSFKAKFLTKSGAVAVFFMGAIIFGTSGLAWAVPILTFFILTSLLSKTGKKIKSRYDLIFEKGSQRDYAQVLANGGIACGAAIFEVFYQGQFCYYVYLGALAAATADTWATEIGVLFGQKPRLVLNFKPVPSGTSGGITLAGSLGGLLGAFGLALSGAFSLPAGGGIISRPLVILIITLSGFLGSMIDSLVGATIQVQYRCSLCGQVTERKNHCEKQAEQISGVGWVNNDVVNFTATLSGAVCAYFGVTFFASGLNLLNLSF